MLSLKQQTMRMGTIGKMNIWDSNIIKYVIGPFCMGYVAAKIIFLITLGS
jgi:hypothetical protein